MNKYLIEDIVVGMSEEFSAKITDDMMEMFKNITGDINPLHCDEEFAKSRDYNGRVVYGMLTSAFYSTLAGVYLPGEHCLLHSVDTKMLKPVYIGDVLTVKGIVSEVHPEMRMFRVKATITNQNNIKVSKAVIQMGVEE